MKKIYIAGPMRGLPGWNFAAFDAAERRLRDAGHLPLSPAATTRAIYGVNYMSGDPEADDRHLRHVMSIDLANVFAADAVAVLPGWERSRGARVELALAAFLGLEVIDAETLEPFHPSLLSFDA